MVCGVAGLVNGASSAHSSNGGSGSGRSRGSSGGRRAMHPAPELAEPTAQPAHGMGALPEDSDVVGEQQVGLSSTQPSLLPTPTGRKTAHNPLQARLLREGEG